MTQILDNVNTPNDLKGLNDEELKQLADELRQETIRIVSNTGGHLGAGLGVIELTVALHHVFDTPKDKLIWDVGHQTYPHKILTGRKDRMLSIRQPEGLAGFTKRGESEYDPFGAGHSSTSISAGLGMAVARDMAKDDFDVISVIGDGAMSAGMAYEALNNAGAIDTKLIVVLNDNDMSIAPAVGALQGYLSKIVSSKTYHRMRNLTKKVTSHLPHHFERAVRRTEMMAKEITMGGNWFEEMGFYYVGPIDGHNLDQLLPVFRNLKEEPHDGPILVHVVTEKGHGFESPEASTEKFHAVKKFDVVTKIQEKSRPAAPSYTKVFADELVNQANQDDKVVAITAAMPSGTGLDVFGKAHPDRTFDVGIAEQHAVTFAAGMACEGYKPFCAIYSTFLQRAYDQVVHDVAIQKLPVRFAIDRAGLVGADGPTHAGSFDITYLASLPHFVVMAASDEHELQRMVATATDYSDGPIAFRYPRGEALGLGELENIEPLEIGKGKIVKEHERSKIAILSFGARLQESLKAAEQLDAKGLGCTVADARFAKPLDLKLINKLAKENDILITIEEGSIGGFGSHVLEYLNDNQFIEKGLAVSTLHLPDEFTDHGKPEQMYADAGLDAEGIVKRVIQLLDGSEKKAKQQKRT